MTGTITERGNGLPGVGDLCNDRDGTTYRIVDYGRPGGHIETHGPGLGNTIRVIVQTSDVEFESDHIVSLETS